METWRERALAEIGELKPRFVDRYGWQPQMTEHDDSIDLYVRLRGARTPETAYVLRLHYQADWQVAGRREAFVDPDHNDVVSSEFWPPEGDGLNPNYQHQNVLTPVICLRGTWGFHSVLHTDQPMNGSPLLQLLLELQSILNHER
jgi:hypothetical protein